MSNSSVENCIFCKIVAKEIPANIVLENDDFLAFLSIDPISPGHTLIIPKKHYRWVWDVPNAGAYFEMAKRVAIAQQKAFAVEMVLSKIVGEEVPHAHIWIYPDRNGGGDKKDFAGNAQKIIDAVKSL